MLTPLLRFSERTIHRQPLNRALYGKLREQLPQQSDFSTPSDSVATKLSSLMLLMGTITRAKY